MPRRDEPVVESGDDDGEGRVWASLSVTVNLGDFNSGKVELGQSWSCSGGARERRKLRRRLADEVEASVVTQVEKLKDIWQHT